MGWIDFVILIVLGLSIWSGYHGGAVRAMISLVGMIIGIEFASRNFQRFAKELAPMVHSLEAANATWFILQVFIVLIAFNVLAHAIQHEVWQVLHHDRGHEDKKGKKPEVHDHEVIHAHHHEGAWTKVSQADGVFGGLLGLVRGIVLAAVCIMSVAAFFPGADTLPDAFLPRYLLGTTAVLANLTGSSMHTKIITGLEATEPNTSNPDNDNPDTGNPGNSSPNTGSPGTNSPENPSGQQN